MVNVGVAEKVADTLGMDKEERRERKKGREENARMVEEKRKWDMEREKIKAKGGKKVAKLSGRGSCWARKRFMEEKRAKEQVNA